MLATLATGCNKQVDPTSSSTSGTTTSQSSTSGSSSQSSTSSSTSGSSTSHSSTTGSTSHSSSSSTGTTSTSGDPIPASGQMLPIGNTTVSGPHNTTRVNLDDYTDFSFYDSLPDNWEYIQGNNKVKNCSDFFENEAGGFKFSHLYYGIQSPLLKTYKKLEVRLYISQLTNSSKKADDTKDIFHYYFYNSTGTCYSNYKVQKSETITHSQVGNFIRFYVTQSEIPDLSYFEIRLNYYASKGSQCYNIGMDKIQLKGWDYE